ncbi:MAG TPA: PQQ-dependent sugar dehydrogenase [Polyangiaceae bacterium]|nr:PQQ-dependent sugar dehydrogenase [Polyangiaceae bacterium]
MQSRLSSRLKLSRSQSLLLAVSAQALMLGYVGCGGGGSSGGTTPMGGTGPGIGGMTSTGGGGTTATGGNVTTGGTAAGGTTPVTGGAGGTPVGTGGATGGMPAVGGAGGTPAGGGGGAGGGAGGSTAMMGPACSTAMGTNDANLTVRRPEISTRMVAGVPAGDMMRIKYDKTSMKIYALSGNGTVYVVDPVANTVTAANTGFGGGTNCRSMAFGPDGTMYIGCGNGGGTSIKISKGTPGAGGMYTWSTLVTTEGFQPSGTNFDHAFNGLVVTPDGASVLFGSGSRTDHGEDEGGLREVALSSAIFKVPTAAPTPMIMDTEAAAAPFLFADGTRNTFDLAYNDAGDLFGAENGPDMDLSDEINFLEQGKHYGFPWRFGDVDNPVKAMGYTGAGSMCLPPTLQAVTKGTYASYDAGFPAAPAGVTFTDPVLNHGPDSDKFRVCPDGAPQDASDLSMTLAGITGHKSPLGLMFDTAGALCGDYFKAGFFMTYGAVEDRFLDGGRDLNLARFTKVGAAYEMEVTQLVAGFGGAPMDATLVGNKIYEVEYGGGGSIIEITLPAAQ